MRFADRLADHRTARLAREPHPSIRGVKLQTQAVSQFASVKSDGVGDDRRRDLRVAERLGVHPNPVTNGRSRSIAEPWQGRARPQPGGRPKVPGSGTGAPELVVTKLAPPVTAPGVIERPRLIAARASATTQRLTLVDAPLGYGKTTLVADWYRRLVREGTIAAWLTLEDPENDPALFWRYVIGALHSAGSPVGAAEMMLGVPGADLGRAVGSLINDLAYHRSPTVLVLDDYHVIREHRCHELMAMFLRRSPPNVHVVITTRSDPPLPLSSLRAASQLAELRARDLQLTECEAAEFVRASGGLELGDDELALLMTRTEGWAAALRLAVVWLRGEADPGRAIREFVGDNRHLADYLTEHVLAGLDPALESFLLKTSILGRMCGPLCEAVTGEASAADLLAQIERANLLVVPLDGRRQWYRYHHLFAGLLQSELARREPGLARILHTRACAWHREHGTVRAAVDHATLAGDYATAAEIIAGSWIRMVRSGHAATVRQWLERLPADAISAAPELGFIGAFVTGRGGAPEREVERWLLIGESSLAQGSAPTGGTPAGRLSIGINGDLVRALFVYRDVAAAAAAAQRAADLSRGASWRVPAFAVLAFLRYLSGDSTSARAAVSEALADRDVPLRPHSTIHALATKALLELDSEDLEKGERSARHALEATFASGLADSVGAGLAHTALGRALVAAGRGAEGMPELQTGVECLRDRAPVAAHLYALLSVADANLAGGDFVSAQRAADEAQAVLDTFEDAGILTTMLADVRRRSQLVRRRRRAGPTTDLSQSELAVLRLLVGQKTRAGVAAELLVSPNTVKTHITSIYRKLGVGSRAQAVLKAREQQLF
jgi:LuxR family maltose regulon positive regulatory protein